MFLRENLPTARFVSESMRWGYGEVHIQISGDTPPAAAGIVQLGLPISLEEVLVKTNMGIETWAGGLIAEKKNRLHFGWLRSIKVLKKVMAKGAVESKSALAWGKRGNGKNH